MTPEAQTTISADGTSIAWYDFGGSGPDLLMSHATGFCASMWFEVATELRPQFRCVAFDSRGHGRSGRPDYGQDGWNWENFADDALAVVEAANMDRPYGVGHSSGGATELLLEERNPGRFSALYLFEPVIFANETPRGPWPDRDLAVRTRNRRDTFASRDAAFGAYRAKGPFAALTDEALGRYVKDNFSVEADGQIRLRCRPDDEAEIYVMATAHDGYRRLGFVPCPAAFAHGGTSTSFTKSQVEHLARCVPQGTFVEFPDLGHFGPLEHPGRFAESVVDFFLP